MDFKYRDFETTLSFLLSWTERLEIEIQELPYDDNDIRKDYFKTCHTNVYNYYIGYISMLQSNFIQDGKLGGLNNVKPFDKHTERFSGIARSRNLSRAYYNTLNQRVFIMAWSLFELSISTFYEAIVNSEELERQFEETYLDVLKNVVVKEGRDLKLRKILIKPAVQSISIVRKYNYLFKLAEGVYSRSIVDDRKFLIFFGKLRNTMHSNFIYFGKDYDFKFGHAHFKFTNNKQVKWLDPFDNKAVPSPELYVYLIGHLNQITKELFKSIEHPEIVHYPDPEAE